MSMGKRKRDRQPAMWVTTTDLPTAASHPFYRRLNQLLREHGFDDFVEAQCASFYAATMGRPGLPPGSTLDIGAPKLSKKTVALKDRPFDYRLRRSNPRRAARTATMNQGRDPSRRICRTIRPSTCCRANRWCA